MSRVLVTGGSRGLGLGISTKLAMCGYEVIAVARNESSEFIAAAREVHAAGVGSLRFKSFDLAEIEALPEFVAKLKDEFGPLYGLINNAALGTSGILAIMPDATIERLLRVNVLSPITLTKYVVRMMMASGGSRIVNIASVVGATGYSGLSVYSATKAALVGFTRSLAREVGPLGITVNAISPGFVKTEMTRGMMAAHLQQISRRSALGRLPLIGDISDAAEFLLSSKARSITGTVLTVDAGNTA